MSKGDRLARTLHQSFGCGVMSRTGLRIAAAGTPESFMEPTLFVDFSAFGDAWRLPVDQRRFRGEYSSSCSDVQVQEQAPTGYNVISEGDINASFFYIIKPGNPSRRSQ